MTSDIIIAKFVGQIDIYFLLLISV